MITSFMMRMSISCTWEICKYVMFFFFDDFVPFFMFIPFDTFANERVTVGENICNNASYMQ